MLRLVDAKLSASRQSDVREQPPARIVDFAEGDFPLPHLRRKFFDIVAQQVELMFGIPVVRMNGHFRWGKPEDEPAFADIDMGQFQNIFQKGAILPGVCAVNDGVCSGYHWDVIKAIVKINFYTTPFTPDSRNREMTT